MIPTTTPKGSILKHASASTFRKKTGNKLFQFHEENSARVACWQGQKGLHVSQKPLLLPGWLSGSPQPWSGYDTSSDSCYQTLS